MALELGLQGRSHLYTPELPRELELVVHSELELPLFVDVFAVRDDATGTITRVELILRRRSDGAAAAGDDRQA